MAWYDNLSGTERDAAAALIDLFNSYGLGSLAPKIVQYIQEGYGTDTIILLLQDTTEYKERFKGNELRRAAGLSVLSPAEYLQVEEGYRQALQAAGLPKGFYDEPKDFHDFIAKDIKPTEIEKRAFRAVELANTLTPIERQVLQERLNLTVGDLAAYYLNAERAIPLIEKKIQTTILGAQRRAAGFDYDQAVAELLYQTGVSLEEARRGYQTIAEQLPTFEKLGEIEGQPFTLSDMEAETFGSSGEAATRRKRLASQERARFSGSAGTGQRTLSRQRTFQN